MTDKTFTDGASPLFFPAGVVNGLFRYTEPGGVPAPKGAVLKLAGADGPPIDVDLVDGADDQNIGVVFEGGQTLNSIISILTKYSGIIAVTCGGTVTRGAMVKTDAAGEIVAAVTADVGTAATGATQTRVLGTVLQSGVVTDIVYLGLHA